MACRQDDAMDVEVQQPFGTNANADPNSTANSSSTASAPPSATNSNTAHTNDNDYPNPAPSPMSTSSYMDVDKKNISKDVIEQAIYEVRQAIVTFLRHRTAENIVPTNSRVVILDGCILLRHAFRALLENGVRAAPVLDLASRTYIDLFCMSHALDTILACRGGPADYTTLKDYLALLPRQDSAEKTDTLHPNARKDGTKPNPNDGNNSPMIIDESNAENDDSNRAPPNNSTATTTTNTENNTSSSSTNDGKRSKTEPACYLPTIDAGDSLLNACKLLRGSYTIPPQLQPSQHQQHMLQLQQLQQLQHLQQQRVSQTTAATATTASISPSASPTAPNLQPHLNQNNTAVAPATPTTPTNRSTTTNSPNNTNIAVPSSMSMSSCTRSPASPSVNPTAGGIPVGLSGAQASSNPGAAEVVSNDSTAPSAPVTPFVPPVYYSGHHHRVAVMDNDTVLCVLDHGRMLRFLHHHLNLSRSRRLLSLTLNELSLSLASPLVSVTVSDPLCHALVALRDHRLGAVPVIDHAGKPRDVFARSDAATLVAGDWPPTVLAEPIGPFLQRLRPKPFKVITCKKTDCLATIFRLFELSRKHRLFVVNDVGAVVAQLTLNDLLCFFLEGA